MVKGVKRNSIYDKIGWTGLFKVVWSSMPYPLRIVALPYGLSIYGDFLRGSANLDQLLCVHSREYMSSKLFRVLRPRYRRVKGILKSYGIDA
ncbi:MAG: hypothetical protein ACYS3S_05720 [Planctomycetota bacterium]|jgi:hypothetical protein